MAVTPDQRKDAERLDRSIARTGLISVMNDTKWRETIEILQSVTHGMDRVGIGIRFRVKEVRGRQPPAGYWNRDFPLHLPRPYCCIEWLEIAEILEASYFRHPLLPQAGGSQQNFTQSLSQSLQARNIPFFQEGGIIRIQGYHRPSKGTHP